MSVSLRSKKSDMYAEIEMLRAVCDKQRVLIAQLQERVTQLSMPRNSARGFMIPKDVAKAYFAANPNAKSVTKDDLVAWTQANLTN